MSLLPTAKKISIFPHFEIYYDLSYKAFNKPADPLILFYHWLLIHNRFKCAKDGEKTDFLPSKWNSAKNYYDLLYTKHNINYRLEIYLIGNLLHINFKRLSDQMDTLQHLKLTDYINEQDYKNPKYKVIYKQLDNFYNRLQWSINTIKQRRKKENLPSQCSVSSGKTKFSSLQSNLSTAGLDYNEIVMQIKKEKINMDKELESLRRSSIVSSITSSDIAKNDKNEPQTAESANNIKNNLARKLKLPRPHFNKADIYEYNPITNFYNYNTDVQRTQTLDENNCQRETFYRESFEKYDLKFSSVEMVGCFKTGILENLSQPVHLTTEMKELLNLNNPTTTKPKANRDKSKGRNTNQTKRKRKSTSKRNSNVSAKQNPPPPNPPIKATIQLKRELIDSSEPNQKTNHSKSLNILSQDSDTDCSLPELNLTNKQTETENDTSEPKNCSHSTDLREFPAFENLNSRTLDSCIIPYEKSDKVNNEHDPEMEDRPSKRIKHNSPQKQPFRPSQIDHIQSKSVTNDSDSEKIQSSIQTVLDSTFFIFEKALKTPDSLRKPKDTSQKSGNNKKRTPVSIKEIFSMQMARQNATPAKSADIMKTPVKTNVSIICTSPLTRSNKKKESCND